MRGARLARAACRSAARSLTANHFSHAPSGEASPRPRPSRRAPGPQSSGTFRPGPVLQQGRSRGFFRLGSTRRCRGLAPPNRFILPSPARPARVSAGGGPGAGTEPACVDPNPRASNSPSAIPAPAPACPGVAERGERQVGARAAVCRRCGTLRRIRVRRHLGFACLSSSSCSFFSHSASPPRTMIIGHSPPNNLFDARPQRSNPWTSAPTLLWRDRHHQNLDSHRIR